MMVPALTTDVSANARAAFIFFALLPHWLLALVWTGSSLTPLYDIDSSIVSTQEIVFAAPLFGVLVPAIILVPILSETHLSTQEYNVLLGSSILLPCTWLPLLAVIFQTPRVLRIEDSNSVGVVKASRASFDDLTLIMAEMRRAYLGYILATAVPLGIFLPIYIHHESTMSGEGEAVLMFFFLLPGCISLLFNVSYRLGLVFFSFNPGISVASSISIAKLTLCAIVVPVIVMLPIIRSVSIAQAAHDVLVAFALSMPALTVLDILRIKFYDKDRKMFIQLTVMTMVVFIIPFIVLLPATVAATSMSPKGHIAMIVLILSPLCCLLGYLVYLTALHMHNLPFQPLTLIMTPPSWVEITFGVIIVCLPMVILLPIFFDAGLASSPRMVLMGFMIAIIVILAVIFAVSCCVRAPGEILRPHTAPCKKETRRSSSLKASISAPSNFEHRAGFNQSITPDINGALANEHIIASGLHTPRASIKSGLTAGTATHRTSEEGHASISITSTDENPIREPTKGGDNDLNTSRNSSPEDVLLNDEQVEQHSKHSQRADIEMPGTRAPGTFNPATWTEPTITRSIDFEEPATLLHADFAQNTTKHESINVPNMRNVDVSLRRTVISPSIQSPSRNSQLEDGQFERKDLPPANSDMLEEGWEPVVVWRYDEQNDCLASQEGMLCSHFLLFD